MKPRRITEKLKNELLELRLNRGSLDSFCFNYLKNFYENAKLMHESLKKCSSINPTAYRQYFVFLVGGLETFFRDLFVYIHSIDDNLLNSLLSEFNAPDDFNTSDELSLAEMFSKSFNFQNLNDIETAFNNLGNDNFLNTLSNTVISPCGFNGKVFAELGLSMVFPDWLDILNQAFSVRHKVVHDANFRPETDICLAQKAESIFLLIPQITTYIIARRYNIKSVFLQSNGNNFPYIFSIHDMLAEDWVIAE
ncbi:HEPN domain-containing protein [uncultured Tolumonas sp.]|uniref:HEPN domain-containing protein n=1 Tax=uncultured Tolumonas sp. TaxID=263765 RepID=UPI0029305B59|nr:HEPN domain-containing protein [uncultured Tolumonas sp.]